MDFKERIYNSVPQFIQRIAVNAYARRLYKRRYSKEYFQLFEEIKYRDRISRDEYIALQVRRLKDTLTTAKENAPYFTKLFEEYGFDPNSIKYPEDISHFPIQTKSTINDNLDTIYHQDYKDIAHTLIHTSGTTGSGLIYPESLLCEREKWCTWWRFRFNWNLNLGMHYAHFGGRTIVPVKQTKPPFWKVAHATNQVFFSFYHLNPDTAKDYVGELNRRKIEWISGNPSTLSYLASLMSEQGLKFGDHLRTVTTGAETLLPLQKKLITQGFGIKPVEMYGLTEPVANISECEYGRKHVDEDYAFVEFLPVDNVENQYRIIGTSFCNETLQFLRYDTCDVAVITDLDQKCECGRQSRVVDSIDGRVEDFITLKDGSKIRGLHYIFKDTASIKEAQIIQDEQGDITFYIVKNKIFEEKDEKKLHTEISLRLRNADYKVEYKENLPRTKNGKLRFVISKYGKETDPLRNA